MEVVAGYTVVLKRLLVLPFRVLKQKFQLLLLSSIAFKNTCAVFENSRGGYVTETEIKDGTCCPQFNENGTLNRCQGMGSIFDSRYVWKSCL